jgi:hypothetical protein
MNLKRRQLANFLQNQAQAFYALGNSQDDPIFSANLTTSLGARGSGDTTPTFSRASTAYVSDNESILRSAISGEARFHGALRVQNWLLKTQDFSGANWLKNSIANSVFTGFADPFSGITAMKLITDNGVSVIGNDDLGSLKQVVTKPAVALTMVVSVYAKAGESSVLRFRETTSTGFRAVFNLATGVASYENTANKDVFGAQMTDVGNGWYRCQARYTTAGGTAQAFGFKASGAGTATTGDGVSGLYVAFAQVEDVTGAAVQACSPYVSVGALSAPWHGANVDGVKYFLSEEIHKQNLLRFSEDLTNATYWNNSGTSPTTIASAGNVGPFGGNATRIVFASGTASLRTNGVSSQVLYGRSYKIGAWVKSNTAGNQTFRLNIFDSVGSFYSSDFTATQQWQYFSCGPIKSLGTTGYLARISNDVALTAADILVGGMTCFEDSPYISTEYIPNLDDRSGLPTPTGKYFDIPSTTAKGFQSEVIATNLLLESETFDTASWTKTDTTVTANFTPAPNGQITADRMATTTLGTDSVVETGRTIVANTQYTFSVYVRPGTPSTLQWIRLRYLNNAGTDGGEGWFDVVNGVVGTTAVVGTGTAVRGEISESKNGFYRCSITATVDAASVSAQVQIITANADNTSTRFNNAIYYLWGAQLEINSEMTSYIPTTAAGVTRQSDYLFYANTGNVVDAGSTLYHEVYRQSTNVTGDRRSLGLSGNTINRLQAITNQTSITGAHAIAGDGVGTITTAPSTLNLALLLRKHAITWQNGIANSVKSKVNAELLGTATGTPSVISTGIAIGGIMLNGLQVNGTVRNVKIYNYTATDAQLIALTA